MQVNFLFVLNSISEFIIFSAVIVKTNIYFILIQSVMVWLWVNIKDNKVTIFNFRYNNFFYSVVPSDTQPQQRNRQLRL